MFFTLKTNLTDANSFHIIDLN